MHQQHPSAGGRDGGEGEVGPPWRSHGVCSDGSLAVGGVHELQRLGPLVVESRPLRAVEWPRLCSAVRDAAPERLQGDDG